MEEYLSEKEQWEWVKAQARDNGPAMLLAVALALGGWAGWGWWQRHLDAGRLDAGAKYAQMVQAVDGNDRARALALLGQLEHDYAASPYTDQARLLAARLYVSSGEFDRAAAELGPLVEHSKDHELGLVARLRLARVQIAQGKADQALTTLNGADPGAFAARYHEVRGDALYAKGERAAALKEYQSGQSGTGDALLTLKIADLAAAAPPPAPGKDAAAAAQPAPPAAAPGTRK